MLVSVKSAVKGYHVYRNEFPEGTILECLQEPENEYSESAIIMKKGETVVGQVPEGLCQLFTKLFNDDRVVNISAEITGASSAFLEWNFCERWWHRSAMFI